MAFNTLREFIAAVEASGQLLRIREPASAELEITAWADRSVKQAGPALYFEQVVGSKFPAVINLFGTPARTALALGVGDVKEIQDEIEGLLRTKPPETFLEKIKMLPLLARLADFPPRRIKRGACQEVVLRGESVNLDELPVLKCWAGDGGRYFTLPCVFTRSPDGRPNCGMYRMQIFDARTTGMHWHPHHDGARHFRLWKERGERMPVSVTVGGDPVVTYAAGAPMPPDVDELFLAGFLRKKPVDLVPCITNDLWVPAEAEFVLEGWVDPKEPLRREGPFGDHTGFYSPPEDYPVFHVEALTHRKNPIYQTLVVGRPPMEDTFLGRATARIFLPFVRLLVPEITDLAFPDFGVFHNCAFVSIHKQYPQHARKVMHALWGMGQLSLTKMIVVVDADVNVRDVEEVWFHVGANCDFSRDVELAVGPLDALDHAAAQPYWGGKMGLDATKKTVAEGGRPDWPEANALPQSVRQAVEEKIKRLKLPL